MSKEHLRKEVITDKNGKRTTVYKKNDGSPATIPFVKKAAFASSRPSNRDEGGLDATRVAEVAAGRSDGDRPWMKQPASRAETIVAALGIEAIDGIFSECEAEESPRYGEYLLESTSVAVEGGLIVFTSMMVRDEFFDDYDWIRDEVEAHVDYRLNVGEGDYDGVANKINRDEEQYYRDTWMEKSGNDRLALDALEDEVASRIEDALDERGEDYANVGSSLKFVYQQVMGATPVDDELVQIAYDEFLKDRDDERADAITQAEEQARQRELDDEYLASKL